MKISVCWGLLGLLISSQAEAQTIAKCEGPDARACQQQNYKTARKTLDRAITDACKKQGVKGTAMLACRAELMTKTAEGLAR
ncbi:MAG TPA: hypothetical protein VHK44_07670 [Xanthobacteraceae bacterium]|jgi:hypothetical protein|nr:hypothetical protein [Xanthobacteraceae bacterium]